MAEYRTLDHQARSLGTAGGFDWTGWDNQLNGHAEEGWRVHTASFPAPGKAVALLIREQKPRQEGVLVTEAAEAESEWGTCVVPGCSLYGELDAQRTCGGHGGSGPPPLNPPTFPRKVPR